ncbi:MAG: ABC transporter permease subunit [Nitrospirae bacterium]|nr:MAG: ABC transporter permease subunit [Nitrospirota bacterium]
MRYLALGLAFLFMFHPELQFLTGGTWDMNQPALASSPSSSSASTGSITVGSKNFMESRLLAEMFAQLIESRTGLTVHRQLGLAGTQVCFEALKNGAIDLYPEYTGTGLVTILGESPSRSRREALHRVRMEFLRRWNLWWLAPLGFENSYALAVPRPIAERFHLRTISDLAKVSTKLRAGFGYEFIERADGLPGLQAVYGLTFQEVLAMQQTLKYEAAAAGTVDVLDVYTTDGRLAVYDLSVLEDDRHFFPPYDAAALVRGDTLDRHPRLASTLALLVDALDAELMRQFNLRLQEHKVPVAEVAHDALVRLELLDSSQPLPPTSTAPERHLGRYVWEQRWTLLARTGEHLALSGIALGLGIALAVPLGFLLERQRRWAEPTIRVIGMSQTIPSIALLAFMIPFFGVGVLPAIVALWIYSLFPIIRNTYSGLRDAAPATVEAARALGMTEWQILAWVRLPLATPVIMAGIRTAAVLTVGTATLSAFIGAGGLGVPIVAGLQLADSTIILSGALPAAMLALAVDGALALIEYLVRPKGLELRR